MFSFLLYIAQLLLWNVCILLDLNLAQDFRIWNLID